MNDKIFLKEAFNKINLNLCDEQINKFFTFKEFLINYNKKVNLTAITENKDILLKHFIDSTTICPFIKKDSKIIDVGTGAGFPGIPIKIIRNDTEITLLDSLNKRVTFLNEAIKTLYLEDLTTVHSRAEDAGQNPIYREKFDYSISRAVAKLSVLAELCLPFVKIGGKFISMKGSIIEDELKEADNAITKLGGIVEEVIPVKIPFTDINHSIIIINKLYTTPSIYPRKAGKISKNPIN